jgi:hypothetical protein
MRNNKGLSLWKDLPYFHLLPTKQLSRQCILNFPDNLEDLVQRLIHVTVKQDWKSVCVVTSRFGVSLRIAVSVSLNFRTLIILIRCTVRLLLFCAVTNKCTIISQIITLLHVSTLSCHPQGSYNQCLVSSCMKRHTAQHTLRLGTYWASATVTLHKDCIYGHHTDWLHENLATKWF